MKHRLITISALITAAALLSGCNGNSPSQNSSETPTSPKTTTATTEADDTTIQVTEPAVTTAINRYDYDMGYQEGYEKGYADGQKHIGADNSSTDLTVNVSGSFTATVRKIIPDYIAEPGNTAAVVTLFQGSPFVLKLNAEMCEKLEEEQTYTFIVTEEKTVIPSDMLWAGDNSVSSDALLLRKISVSDVRAAEEDEFGMNCWRVKYFTDQ